MRPLGANARTILALFDEQLGGLAAPASVVGLILSTRHVEIEEKNLLITLGRLAKRGELSKIPRPKEGALYTRPRNLEAIPGYRSMLERFPVVHTWRRASTTDRRYELRKQRAIRALGDELVRAGCHDYRYDFKRNRWYPCLTCGRDATGRFGPCKLRIAADEAAKKDSPAAGVRTSGNESASLATYRSRARKHGT